MSVRQVHRNQVPYSDPEMFHRLWVTGFTDPTQSPAYKIRQVSAGVALVALAALFILIGVAVIPMLA